MSYQTVSILLIITGIGILGLSLIPAIKLHNQDNNKGWHLLLGLIVLFLLAYTGVLYRMVIAPSVQPIGAGFGLILWSGSIFVYLSITMFLRSLMKLKLAADEYAHALCHDSLTQLPNRNSMIAELEEKITSSIPVSLYLVDVIQFNRINNTLGSHYGDYILNHISELLTDKFGDYCSVHRVGGNEFSLLISGEKIEQAERVTEELNKLHDILVCLDDYQVHINLAVGTSQLLDTVTSSVQLIERSNVALQAAKSSGGGVKSFDESMINSESGHPDLLNKLIQAIRDDRLEVHYQPIVDAKSKLVKGVEALTRWPKDDGGYVSPADFIPVAEKANKISTLTIWLIERIASDLGKLSKQEFVTDIHINLSAKDLLNQKVLNLLEWHATNTPQFATNVSLEITESAAFEQNEVTHKAIGDLRKLGFNLSLDDFGTGYSSLCLLRALPVQQVKLDRSFVSNIDNNFNDYNIVKTMIELGHILGYTVVAEGVERDEIAAELEELGCDYMQGFLFSKAVPLDELIPTIHPGDTLPECSDYVVSEVHSKLPLNEGLQSSFFESFPGFLSIRDDQHRFVYINDNFHTWLKGFTDVDPIGKTGPELAKIVPLNVSNMLLSCHDESMRLLELGTYVPKVLTFASPEGEQYYEIVKFKQQVGSREYIFTTGFDVTELHESARLYKEKSLTCSLTGLNNKRALVELIKTEETGNGVVIAIDLDNFKQVNDENGHIEGDRVLKKFAQLLQESFRSDDFIARVGGDEFLIYCRCEAGTLNLMSRIDDLNQRFRASFSHQYAYFNWSWGSSEFIGELQKAIHEADKTMYQHKQANKQIERLQLA